MSTGWWRPRWPTRAARTPLSAKSTTNAVAVLHTAFAAIGEQNRPERARLLAQIGMELTFSGDWDVDRRSSATGPSLPPRAGDDNATVAHCLLLRHESMWHAETLGDRWPWPPSWSPSPATSATPSSSASRRCGAPTTRSRRSSSRSPRRGWRTRGAWPKSSPSPGCGGSPPCGQATWAMVNGRLEDAERHILDQWRLGRTSGQPDAALLYATQQFQIARLRGRLGDIDPEPITANVDARPTIAGLRVGLAARPLRTGRDRRCRLRARGPGSRPLRRHPPRPVVGGHRRRRRRGRGGHR